MKNSKIIILFVIILLCLACGCTEIKEDQQVQNIKEGPLSEDDFDINYEALIINDKIDINEITSKIGFGIGHEDNNYGFISQNADIDSKIWELYYPDRDNAELRLVIITIGIENSLFYADLIGIPTKRGLEVGDSYEKLISLYGEPTLAREDKSIQYVFNNKKMVIYIDKDTLKIKKITLRYNEYDY